MRRGPLLRRLCVRCADRRRGELCRRARQLVRHGHRHAADDLRRRAGRDPGLAGHARRRAAGVPAVPAQTGGKIGKFTVKLATADASKISDNARTAIEDTSAIAYLGELDARRRPRTRSGSRTPRTSSRSARPTPRSSSRGDGGGSGSTEATTTSPRARTATRSPGSCRTARRRPRRRCRRCGARRQEAVRHR